MIPSIRPWRRLPASLPPLSALGIVLLGIVLLGGCGKAKNTPTSPAGPTPAGMTESGWLEFESGRYQNALADFDQAVLADTTYGSAFVGQGWTRLSLATETVQLTGALTSFDIANRHTDVVEGRAGRAAALLALGDGHWDDAAAAAAAARVQSPSFVFSHRSTFDIADLLLIEAMAHLGHGQFDLALDAADKIEASGIHRNDASTWVVGQTLYTTFEDAVLAWLEKLSNERAG